MTPHEAIVLAHVGWRHRRLRDAITRYLAGRPIDGDPSFPERSPGETMAEWLCHLVAAAPASPKNGRSPTPAALDRIADAFLARAGALGVSAIPIGAEAYPRLLAEIPDPPPVLWARGHVPDLQGVGVALVGSRSASAHGLAMARTLGRDLAASGVVVISGLARGIDSAAHEAALTAGGRTVAVLGSSVDRIYPPEHRDLARRIEGAGTVVSELPPGTAPRAHHFPLRNRIISGLSRAVVVVEAPKRSGALITAASAVDQNRDVFVVPGPVVGERNRGGHGLLRDGAMLVEEAADILHNLGRPVGPQAAPPPEPHPWLREMAQVVDFTVDDLAEALRIPAADVLAGLLELELAGRIQRVGGGRFVRCQPVLT